MKRKYIALILFLATSLAVFSQNINVSGVVTDENDEPLVGVSVIIKGKNIGTTTNLQGRYSLQANRDDELVFTLIGMKPFQRKADTSVINVKLQDDSKELEDIVVIGYGSVRKSDLTGAVGSVRSSDLMSSSPITLDQGLQGRVAGVMVQQVDGTPGGGMSIQIRGANSFSGGTQPLYVVDDIPYEANSAPGAIGNDYSTTNPLALINPNDIESIEVLKDASATAIYGSRGANGVVLIKTKQGQAGRSKIEVSVNQGWSVLNKTIDVLNAEAYAKMYNEARINADMFDIDAAYIAGNNMKYLDVFGTKGKDYHGVNYYKDHSTNWQDMIFQTGKLTDASVAISGGSEKLTYMVSVNLTDQSGIIKSSGYQKSGIRANIQGPVSNNLTFGLNTNISWSDNRFVRTGSDVGQAGGIIRSALRYPPVYSPFTQVGDVLDEWYDASNPYTYMTTQKNQVTSYKNTISGYLEAKFLKSKELKLRVRLGNDWGMVQRAQYLPAGTRESKTGQASYRDNINNKLVNENLLSYNKSFNKAHRIDAVAAFTWEKGGYTYRNNSASGFLNDYLLDYSMQTANEIPVLSNGRTETALMSGLARVNYSYLSRYLLTASIRADGSSKFAKNNKWAYFPSLAFAWRLNEEKFINNLDFFDNLKLRLSYGETGNQGISPYASLTRMNAVKYPFENVIYTGVAISSSGLGNDNLTWESTSQYNAGLDVGILQNRLFLTVDLYYKHIRSLLQNQELPLSLGYSSRTMNMGALENKGLEITLGAIPVQTNNFSWRSDFNISFNTNKILSLGEDIPSQTVNRISDGVEPFRLVVGRPLGEIYAYKTLGIYQNIDEVKADGLFANDPATERFMVGEYRFYNASNPDKNADGDFILNAEDMVVVGQANPKFVFGFSNSFNYKRFDLSFLIQGVIGNNIVNTTTWSMEKNIGGESSNIRWSTYNNLWRGEGTSNDFPKAAESKKRLVLFSDRFVEDGSFIKLKSINFGYNLPLSNKIIKSLKLSAIVTNVFTLTKYSGFDPEVNAFNSDPIRRGVDMGNYPGNSTISANIIATF